MAIAAYLYDNVYRQGRRIVSGMIRQGASTALKAGAKTLWEGNRIDLRLPKPSRDYSTLAQPYESEFETSNALVVQEPGSLPRTRLYRSKTGRLFRVPVKLRQPIMPKRSSYAGKYKHAVVGGKPKYPRAFVPGRDRTGGLYGRFGPMGEKKFHDEEYGLVTVTNEGIIQSDSVLTIPQGTTQSERIGRIIKVTNMSIHGYLMLPGANSLVNSAIQCRMVVYLDKQANGTTAATTDLYDNLSTLNYSVQAFRNLSNSKRFAILSDKTYTFNAAAAAGDVTNDEEFAPIRKPFRINKNWPQGLPIEYSVGTTGAIGQIKQNNIGVMAFGGAGLIKGAWNCRVRFTDN